jgi:hypothetical protein
MFLILGGKQIRGVWKWIAEEKIGPIRGSTKELGNLFLVYFTMVSVSWQHNTEW